MLDVQLPRPVELGIEVAFQPADQIGGDEAENASCRGLCDEMAEAADGHAARPALIDHRGDAGAHADHIGIQPELSGDMLVDVAMRVDHSGGDDAPGKVDHLARRLGGGWTA